MKKIFLILLISLSTCYRPAMGQELKYSTFYLATWVVNCSQQLSGYFRQQGYPHVIAIRIAAQHCSCVVDQFRINFEIEEVENMSYPDRQLFSEKYAMMCRGINET